MGGGELPGLLLNEIGGIHGIMYGHMAFLKKHFYLITMKEFLENRKHMSKKVQAIYLWCHKSVIDQELLQSLPNLKVIANSGGGMDHPDLKLVASFGVKMANAPHAVSSSTVDTGIALLLKENVRKSLALGWKLGLITNFALGCALTHVISVVDIPLFHSQSRKEQEEQAGGATYCEKTDSLLQQAEFVMVVVSLTPQTHKLIGKREMELMRPTATLINISRHSYSKPGAGVDQGLVTALQTGVIRAAALDATYPEPLPRDHMLLKLKNIIIMPHFSIKTDRATYMITEEAVENIPAAFNGLPIPSEVLPR
ncbi:LOW QUALITY PROTEIN: putative 2-ketogluconate reductase [Ciconia maguari]